MAGAPGQSKEPWGACKVPYGYCWGSPAQGNLPAQLCDAGAPSPALGKQNALHYLPWETHTSSPSASPAGLC